MAGLHGFTRVEGRRRAAAAIERFGLGSAGSAFTSTYSLGMRKRLALAAALLHEPRVLILDEPQSGLDPRGARDMRETVTALAQEGRTIFLATHLLDVAERLCHRLAIISDGRLRALGTPEELRARAAVGPEASLEDLFLRVTEP